MEKLVLKFIGKDSWSRPVFIDQDKNYFKDVDCDNGKLELCTACGFESEPDTQINDIKEYQNITIEITGRDKESSNEEKFNSMMLDRLRCDCEYFLNYGNRSIKILWDDDVSQHISEMKKLHNGFGSEGKPDWLTYEKILEYEELKSKS